ncbi:MAG: hypothetical protein V2I43_11120 [Parvularcula sp.]|jgi:hypothetical protein|nr:hypothetical protein [Parvularcula sp.]
MTNNDRKPSHRSLLMSATVLMLLFIGVMLFEIIAIPDEGGIWDGYTPAWLGGDGPQP